MIRTGYLKEHWFSFLMALVCLGLAIYYFFQPAGDTTTIEGVNQNLTNMIMGVGNLLGCANWLFSSVHSYHDDRIKLLEARIKELEKRKDEC
jgi:hypothetical protein